MRKILLLTAVAVVLTGCFQSRKKGQEAEETVKAFYENLCSGEFDKAESMCDTLMMKEYMTGLQTAWTSADSSVMAIVPAILSETVVTIDEVIKDGQERTVYYRLTATDSQDKEKTATLKKEEGAWKIVVITDRH